MFSVLCFYIAEQKSKFVFAKVTQNIVSFKPIVETNSGQETKRSVGPSGLKNCSEKEVDLQKKVFFAKFKRGSQKFSMAQVPCTPCPPFKGPGEFKNNLIKISFLH